jgi:hypothetical protein
VPTSRGSGTTPGQALQEALDGAGGATWAPPTSRKAVSTSARVRALTRSGKGYTFLLGAGLNPRQHTLVDWLSGITPGKESVRKINRAYENYYQSLGKLIRSIPAWVKSGQTDITGLVLTEGHQPRHRGVDEAPLAINNSNGEWEEVTRIYVAGDPTEELWDQFVEDVILEDIDFSVLDFPGNDYTIELLS